MIYHWIYVSFFLLSTTSLFSAEVTLTTQKEVTEALQTIGKFLKDDGGPAWLTSLVTKQSAPLTTGDLMNEILNATKANDNVKQAANIIKAALGEPKQPGTNTTLVLEFDVWKDMIDNVEQQEDIVCLYRRSYNASNERSDDWKKFLQSISPNHTIYLALDMGHKYVICLKHIKEPEQNITNRNLDTTNDTASNSSDSLTKNSSIPGQSETSSGSRSLSHGDTSIKDDNDKCESPDVQPGHTSHSRSMPTNLDFVRRTLPTQNSDSPCNRPIILMLPPNYMPIMGGYNTPAWPRNGYQVTPNPFRSQSMPSYQSRIPPWLPSSPVYSYPTDKYRHFYDYGRKQLPAPSRSSQESQDDNKRMNPNYDYRNAIPNSRENIPRQAVRAGQFQPSFRPTFPNIKPVMARSFPHPWSSARPQLEHGNRQGNFMFPSFPMSPQAGHMRPPYYLHYSPSSPPSLSPAQQNCISCASPCDKPILLKVLVENPSNQLVTVGLMHSREIDDGRRRLTERVVERENGNVNEKNGATAEENGGKEIG